MTCGLTPCMLARRGWAGQPQPGRGDFLASAARDPQDRARPRRDSQLSRDPGIPDFARFRGFPGKPPDFPDFPGFPGFPRISRISREIREKPGKTASRGPSRGPPKTGKNRVFPDPGGAMFVFKAVEIYPRKNQLCG